MSSFSYNCLDKLINIIIFTFYIVTITTICIILYFNHSTQNLLQTANI